MSKCQRSAELISCQRRQEFKPVSKVKPWKAVGNRVEDVQMRNVCSLLSSYIMPKIDDVHSIWNGLDYLGWKPLVLFGSYFEKTTEEDLNCVVGKHLIWVEANVTPQNNPLNMLNPNNHRGLLVNLLRRNTMTIRIKLPCKLLIALRLSTNKYILSEYSQPGLEFEGWCNSCLGVG